MRSLDSSQEVIDADVGQAVMDARLGRADALETVMREHNQRLFRIARSILRNDAEAEDIVQDAFVKAFTNIASLRDAGSIGAWLGKITANLALSRLRQLKLRDAAPTDRKPSHDCLEDARLDEMTPERLAAMADIRRTLEREIDHLPDGFREVFVLRTIEQMTIEETAAILNIRPETVKTRLHRAKAALRTALEDQFTAGSLTAFPFGGVRCARTTKAVLTRLQALARHAASTSHH